jgi:hypothetical protein
MSGKIITALRAMSYPVFAAIETGSATPRDLVVHLPIVPERATASSEIVSKLTAAGAGTVSVVFHEAAALNAPKSLESLCNLFRGDTVLYDPSNAVSGARSLVDAARSIRTVLGTRISGICFAPLMRTVFVTLNGKGITEADKVKVESLASMERSVVRAFATAFKDRHTDSPSVRIGFGYPNTVLVPVDNRSVVTSFEKNLFTFRRSLKPLTIATLFGLGTAAGVAADPAVNQSNLKFTGLGGQVSGDQSWTGVVALTSPIGQEWGLQLEGGVSDVNSDTQVGAAAHLFTRDPDSHLLGVFVAHTSENDFNLDATRIGAEAEIYLQQVTVLAKAGYQFSEDIGDTAFANLDVRWYATDNLALTAGGDFANKNTVGRLEAEYMPGFAGMPGLAFNVRGAVGNDDYDSVMAGMTYYFGTDAGLKDRHRKQDPDSALFGLFQTVESEREKLAVFYASPA